MTWFKEVNRLQIQDMPLIEKSCIGTPTKIKDVAVSMIRPWGRGPPSERPYWNSPSPRAAAAEKRQHGEREPRKRLKHWMNTALIPFCFIFFSFPFSFIYILLQHNLLGLKTRDLQTKAHLISLKILKDILLKRPCLLNFQIKMIWTEVFKIGKLT